MRAATLLRETRRRLSCETHELLNSAGKQTSGVTVKLDWMVRNTMGKEEEQTIVHATSGRRMAVLNDVAGPMECLDSAGSMDVESS